MRRQALFGRDNRLVVAMLLALALIASSSLLSQPRVYATVPNGFSDQLVTSISAPTDIAFLPSGTMLVTRQGGYLYKRSGGATTQILNISGKICSDFERGLLGVAVDPDYDTNNYIYLFYTFNKNSTCVDNSPYSPVNRVSRFTLSGSTVNNETVLVDNMPSPNGNHNAGGIVFGKDGYLYIAIGDGGCEIGSPSECAGANDNARVKHRLQGKILRVNRNGVAPSSNPFYSGGGTCRSTGSTTSGLHCRETYAWGLRNPFKIAADPNGSSTRIFANDVGQGTWEEIDHVQSGKDYGWNFCEGFYDQGTGNFCGFADANPIYNYSHGSCNSITGGAFIPNGSWPSTYDGTYFFADYTCGTIWTLKNSGGTWSRTVFASGLGAITELEFGPYNNGFALYYANYGSSQIRRISYTDDDNRAPVADIDASPSYGELPLEVSFDGRDSTDPDADTLTYKWNFGDGTSSTSSHPNKTYTEKDEYTVILTVSDGRGGTDTDSVKIDAGNTRPTAVITGPKATDEYFVGETITLKGSGTDAEDDPSAIPASRKTWEVLLHHDTHTHPWFGPTTGNYLTFEAPAPEDLAAAENSYLEIRLTVRDLDGLGKMVSMNFYPNKVDVTVDSNVEGMGVWIEGTYFTTPATVTTWENNPLTVEAPDQIGEDNEPYLYDNWSDGGTRKHDYDTPGSNSTVTANFEILEGDTYFPHADARVAEAYPDRNEGSGTGLSAKGTTSSDYESFIRFKLEGVGDTIYRARLYLYAYDGTSSGPSVYTSYSSWSESTIAWENKPGATSGEIDDYGPIASHSWIAYNVIAAIDGDGYVTFLLRSSTSDAASFYSRQLSGTGFDPRLVIWSDGLGPAEFVEAPTATATATAIATADATATAEPTETAVPTMVEPTATIPAPTSTEVPTEIPPASTPEAATETATPEPAPAVELPFVDNFESGLGAWTVDGASIAPGSGIDGSTALNVAATGTNEIAGLPSYVRYLTTSNEQSLHVAFDLRTVQLAASGTRLVSFTDANGDVVASIYLLQDGSMAARWNESDSLVPMGKITPEQWQQVEVQLVTAGNSAELRLWIDGQAVASSTEAVSGLALSSVIVGGWATDRTYQLLLDNAGIDRNCVNECPEMPIEEPTAVPTETEIPVEGSPVA